MLSLDEARQALYSELTQFSTVKTLQEKLIRQCVNYVLAEDIYSSIHVPPADNSAMDGYAVHTDDLANQAQTFTLKVSQRIPAGVAPQTLQKGTAARIFTGAEIPIGANAVVMQENCKVINQETIEVKILPTVNANIRPMGQDIKKGECVLKKGTRLKAEHLALLASIGKAKINVYAPLRVGIFSTGDELVEPGKTLAPGQIYNSNQTMMMALLSDMNCEVICHHSVEDTFEASCEALKTLSQKVDLIISSGGVSVGEEDHIKTAVEHLGKLSVWKVNIKPGKPFAFGEISQIQSSSQTKPSTLTNSIPFIGLPGNPVSAYVTFLLLGKNIIRKLQNEKHKPLNSFQIPTKFSTSKPSKRPEYIRARFSSGRVERFANQSSGVLSSVCWAEGLALIPNDTIINEGDLIEVYPWALL